MQKVHAENINHHVSRNSFVPADVDSKRQNQKLEAFRKSLGCGLYSGVLLQPPAFPAGVAPALCANTRSRSFTTGRSTLCQNLKTLMLKENEMRCDMESSTKCLIWSAIHNYFLSVFFWITFSTAWSRWEDNTRCCFWISYTFALLYLNITMLPLLIFLVYKTALAFQRKSPWPKYQRILNWEVIYWCKSLNLFAFAYWTLTQKLNYIV